MSAQGDPLIERPRRCQSRPRPAVLASDRAAMSVYAVRAFARRRHELLAQVTSEERPPQTGKNLMAQDGARRDLRERTRPLLPPPEPPKGRLGFPTEPE